jgi:hydroxypyruvate isomerase
MNEDGEVNHRYFLSKLIAPFYQDFIGLEYFGKTQVQINISIDDFIFISRFKQRII